VCGKAAEAECLDGSDRGGVVRLGATVLGNHGDGDCRKAMTWDAVKARTTMRRGMNRIELDAIADTIASQLFRPVR
jgi:hypothetical protein